jgi:oxalate decarboxylase
MTEFSRREVLGAGIATTAAVAGLAASDASGSSGGQSGASDVQLKGPGAPDLPPADETYRFPLTKTKPEVATKGGTVVECTVKNFPAVGESEAAIFLLRMEPGALREPHWHPNAWELEYVVQGKARLGVITPDGTVDTVELGPGDVGFVPRAWGHYIQNIGNNELVMPITFGNKQPDDIGLSTFFSGCPTSTFTRTLGLPKDGLANANKPGKTLFIVAKG